MKVIFQPIKPISSFVPPVSFDVNTARNNFDLIRLLAASLVVIGHAHELFKPPSIAPLDHLLWWLAFFPGVPVFFTVSGFLIYWSFERNADNITGFFKNRFLRIYPGLWVCFAITIVLLAGFRQISLATLGRVDFWGWVARQVTFFQFGTPDILRHWGDGQVNRSLWTISIELQFYALLPLIYYVLQRFGKQWMIGWAILFAGSIGVYVLQSQLPKGNIVHDIKELSVSSCLFNFLYGIAFYKCWDRIKFFVEGRFLYWLAAYLAFVFVFGRLLGWYHPWPYSPEPIRLLGYLLLSTVTISLAFSFRGISEKLIKGFDISYGVYIYHGLALNCFICFGWMYRWDFVFSLLAISCALGSLSWVLVERPVLRMKSRTLRTLPAVDVQFAEITADTPAGVA